MKTITKIVLCSIILCAITAAVTYYVAQIGVHRTGTISAAPQGFVPKAHFKKAHAFVLANEGGLSKATWDSGGPTKYGISKRFLRGLNLEDGDINHDGKIDEDDILCLNYDDCERLSKKYFWDKIQAGEIDDFRVAAKYYDAAINMGNIQAAILVKRAIERIAPHPIRCDLNRKDTIVTALNKLDPEQFLPIFIETLKKFYRAVAARKVNHGVWSQALANKVLGGWIKRAELLPTEK